MKIVRLRPKQAQNFTHNEPWYNRDEIASDNDSVQDENEIPVDTCPLINQVIKGIGNAIDRLGSAHKSTQNAKGYTEDQGIAYLKSTADEIDSAISDLSDLEDILEQIRTANQTLRELGKIWYTQSRWIEKNFPSSTQSTSYDPSLPISKKQLQPPQTPLVFQPADQMKEDVPA